MREQEWLTSESPERMEEFTRPRVKELWTEFEAWRNVCMSMGDMPLPDTDSGRATWCHRYRDVFGNPFRPVVLRSNLENNINTLPATATVKDTVFYDQWLTPDVQAIVAGMLTPKECPCLVFSDQGLGCSKCNGTGQTYDFSDMPILADALEDAGCKNEEVLNHCRMECEPGMGICDYPGHGHTPGCWVLRLLRPTKPFGFEEWVNKPPTSISEEELVEKMREAAKKSVFTPLCKIPNAVKILPDSELAQLPTLCIWNDRAVKLHEDGTWFLSRRHDYEDFNFYPERPDNDTAIAGFVGIGGSRGIVSIELDGDLLLLFDSQGLCWTMTASPGEGLVAIHPPHQLADEYEESVKQELERVGQEYGLADQPNIVEQTAGQVLNEMQFAMTQYGDTCPGCDGTGRVSPTINSNPKCLLCDGVGRIEEKADEPNIVEPPADE